VAESERDALFQVLDALEALQIPYMVVGSFASTFWGRPRMTHDADLVVEITGDQVALLARLLAPNFYAPLFVIEDAVRKRGQFNLIHLDYAFKVDLWLRKESPYDAACFDRRLLGIVFDREVWVSSPEDVILSKLLWYQGAPVLERQFQDVLEVYEIQEPHLEHDYLERWAHTLGIADLLDRVKREAARPPDEVNSSI
jgi:hypothetical protein